VSLYSADKLIAQARLLAAEYRRTMGKPLPGISNEIAGYDAIHLLDLQPAPADAGGYDAIDPARDGKRIQIKSRAIFDEGKSGQRIGQLRMDQAWDSVLLVLMDEEYQPYEIYEAEREDIESYVRGISAQRRRRGAMSVARFKIIGQLRWTQQDGIEAELWDNQSA
jgi:hypothetical protein